MCVRGGGIDGATVAKGLRKRDAEAVPRWRLGRHRRAGSPCSYRSCSGKRSCRYFGVAGKVVVGGGWWEAGGGKGGAH